MDITHDHNSLAELSELAANASEFMPLKKLMLQNIQDWQETFDALTDMVTIHDRSFNIIYANKSAQESLKLSPLEFSGKKCFSYYHGADSPPEGCPSCGCLKTGKDISFETFEPHLNMYLEVRAIPRFDKDNRLIGLIHIARDITERKKIESAMREARAEWETTFDSMTELIMIIDNGLNIIRCNKSFTKFAGKDPVGLQCKNFFPCSSQKAGECRMRILKGESMHIEMQTKCGLWFNVNHHPIFNNNRIEKTIIVATDITNLKKTQEMLESSQEELRQRVHELEKFYEMAVTREVRMADLKKELKKMKEELSQYREHGNTR